MSFSPKPNVSSVKEFLATVKAKRLGAAVLDEAHALCQRATTKPIGER